MDTGYTITTLKVNPLHFTGPVAPSAGSPPAVVTIPTVAGWNFVGVSDVTRANTEGADGTTIKTQEYFGDLKDTVQLVDTILFTIQHY